MKTYVEIAQEWGSEIDVEAANDEDEIEILELPEIITFTLNRGMVI